MIFRRFPYTTINDLNLDWIVKQVKQIATALQGKQDKPEAAGVAGQVLGLDDNLYPVWLDQSGGGGGTTNYNSLSNKPQINGVMLTGNKTTADLGITIPTGSLALPRMDGTASAGTNISRFALEGHVHPTDTTRIAKAGDTMTGALRFGTSDNTPYGVLTYYQENNRTGLMLYGYRAATATLNALRLIFNNAGDLIVEVSSPKAWRTALGLVATEESMILSPTAQKTYTLANSEHGIIVTSGGLEATRGMIIYNVNSGGLVSYTMLGNAASVAVATAASSITITNNANVLFSVFKMTW